MEIFNNEEKILINKASEGTANLRLSKESLLAHLYFVRSISTDADISYLLEGLIDKSERLTEDEWETIFNKLPFETDYDLDASEYEGE